MLKHEDLLLLTKGALLLLCFGVVKAGLSWYIYQTEYSLNTPVRHFHFRITTVKPQNLMVCNFVALHLTCCSVYDIKHMHATLLHGVACNTERGHIKDLSLS